MSDDVDLDEDEDDEDETALLEVWVKVLLEHDSGLSADEARQGFVEWLDGQWVGHGDTTIAEVLGVETQP